MNGDTVIIRATVWPYRLAMMVIIAGMLTLGAMLTYVLWPQRVVYISEPIGVETSPVVAGDYVAFILDYSKPFKNETLVGVMFASKGTIALSPVGMSALPVGDHHIRFLVQVPPALPEGEYVAIMIIDSPVRLPLPSLFNHPTTATSVPFRVVRP